MDQVDVAEVDMALARGTSTGRGFSHGSSHASPSTQTSHFTGQCDALKGFIYDCNTGKNADGFNKTTKEIAEYVNREYTYGSHLRAAIITQDDSVRELDKPTDITANTLITDKEIWKQEISAYIKKKTAVTKHVRSLFSLILGQCTDTMKAKLEALSDWATRQKEMNGLSLIKEIKQIAFCFKANRYQPDALYDTIRRFSMYNQANETSNPEYLRMFQSHVQVIEHCGGTIWHHPGILDAIANEMHGKSYTELTKAQKPPVAAAAKEAYLACVFLKKAD